MKKMWIAVAAMAGMAAAPVGGADHMVRIEIRDGDRLVAQPALRVREGVPAAISTADYALRIRIDPAKGRSRDYLLRSSFQLPDGNGHWKLVASPWMLVAHGSEGSLSVAAQGLPSYRFTLRVN